jgi:hypothetical protein
LVVGHVDLATAAWRKYRVLASATTKGVAMAMSNVWLWDATAAQLAAALDAGETTSVAIVSALMDRISLIDAPGTEIELRSVLARSRQGAQPPARHPDPGEGQHRGGRATGHGGVHGATRPTGHE